MKWPVFDRREKINLLIAVLLCLLFSIRYYPHNLEKSFFESFRWIFAFFFYSGAITYIFHGLFRKMFKKTFSFKSGIKFALWLAVFFALSQSIHEVFFPEYKGTWSDALKLLGLSKH